MSTGGYKMELKSHKLFSQAREKSWMMIPGPTEVPWRVISAMMRPNCNHHDPKFNIDVLDDTLIKLRQIFRTANEIIAVPGSGRVGQQAAISSLIEPGDKVFCIVAGIFGGWMREMVQRVGGVAVEYPVEWGKDFDIKKIEIILDQGKFKAITVVHNETTTGSVYTIKQLGILAKQHDLLLIVDTVSSIGGVYINTDEWNIDVNLTASHKCMAAPTGLAILSISKRAWKAMEERKTPAADFAYDLYRWKKMWIPPERGGNLIFGFRRQPISMPVYLVFALQEAVKMILEEGIDNRIRRHQVSAQAVRAAVHALNLELFPEKGIASDTVTAIRIPEGVDGKKVLDIMNRNYGISIAGGLEKLATAIWRIGHMGMVASPDFILPTLRAFECALKEVGFLTKLGEGVEAANSIFQEKSLTSN
jgi:aspartate aminotransferase-like enzyme